MKLTKEQAQALASAVRLFRPDWHYAGTMKALERAANLGSPAMVARALFDLADNPQLTTPGLLPQAGPHWHRADGSSAKRESHAMRCPEHPDQTQPCQPCKADATPMPDEVRTALADAVAKGQAAIPHTSREPLRPKAALNPKETRR